MPLRNDGINRLLAAGDSFRFAYARAERLPIFVRNDFMAMAGEDYHLIMDHPWFAVTDAEGKFRIDDLPPGRHEFVVWHERAGYLERRHAVTIASGRTTETVEQYPLEMFLDGTRGSGGARPANWIGPFDLSTSGDAAELVTAQRLLRFLLDKKIKGIDRICVLTDEQKQKLELAGRGDIERLLERIVRLREKYVSLLEQSEKLKELLTGEVEPMRAVFRAGPFDEGSLFAKVRKSILTAGQAAQYDREQMRVRGN